MKNLLLKHIHEKRAHCGLVYETRKRFWIVVVRKMAQQVTSKCVTCKKLRRKTVEQLMAQIPKLRVVAGLPGADGLVRKAQIKTATSVYDQPIHKLNEQ